MAGSFVVGVGQIAEAWVVRRDRDPWTGPIAAFSLIEFSWAIFAGYLAALYLLAA